ncbi:PHD finger protein At1g33420 [Linum perenne]
MNNNRPLKRARRNRITADLHDFLTFPAAGGEEAGPFRETVKAFLSNHARLTFPPSLFPSLLTWQIAFRIGDLVDGPDLSPLVVSLDIVEEDVTRSPRSVYCNQCRVVGWSSHPVCRKRYHFIIRASTDNPTEGFQKLCTKCGNSLQLSDCRCKWCDFVVTSDDLEEWVYTQLEDSTHLLHGVVHSNGFGHLLRVNGKEGGSQALTGTHIMNFWDRLCTALSVRKVSVMDVSKKYGTEYRLLHAITKGHSWYGNWGYEFGTGSYALTSGTYRGVVEALSSVYLDQLSFHGRGPRSRLQAAIAFYKSLSSCELLTLKDLFTFLLRLIQETKTVSASKLIMTKNDSGSSSVLCVWTRNDVEEVQQSMIKVLTAAASSETKWVARHTLKGVMCRKASPELLDYSLTHFEGTLAPKNMVVRARCSPSSYDVEFRCLYRLEPASVTSHQGLHPYYPSKEQLKSDLKFLFDSLINPETMEKFRPSVTRQAVIDSATKLIDCKQFMKDFKPEKKPVNYSSSIYLTCHLELSDQSREEPAIPPELLVLPLNATVADLKNEAGKAFQEVYAMCKRLQIDALLEYGSVEDSFTLKFLVGSIGTVRMRGTCSSKSAVNRYRLERGTEKWTVDCTCGAKDDDGERMLACDSCGVWQHTRCAGIENCDPTPDKFVCIRCKSLLREKRSDSDASTDHPSERSSPDQMSTCRGNGTATIKLESNELPLTFSVG